MGNVLVGIPTRIQVPRCGENLLGHYPTVTGTPAKFILRIGWAKRSPPGRGALRLRTPANLAVHFSVCFSFGMRFRPASPSIAAGSCPAILLLGLRASSPEPRANPLQ